MGKFIDLTGQKFGRLTVKGKCEYKTKRGSILWECICACGIKIHVTTGDLSSGHTKSCGCLSREKSRNRSKNNTWGRKEKGVSGFNRVYEKYKKHAKDKGRTFELTKTSFRELTSSTCYYCGCEPKTLSVVSDAITTESIEHSKYIYNGIDRINNEDSYVLSNCVTCCEMCNRMKMAYKLEEFKEKVESIYKHWIQNEKGPNPLKTEEKISKEGPNEGLEVPSYDI